MKTETKAIFKIFLRLKFEEIRHGLFLFFKMLGIGIGLTTTILAGAALLSLLVGFIHLHLFDYVWNDGDSKNIWIKYMQNGFQDWGTFLIGIFFSLMIIAILHMAYKNFTGWIKMNWWRANREYKKRSEIKCQQ